MKRLTLSQAIDGYLLYAQARRLSPHTIADYHNTFRKLQAFLASDFYLDEISNQVIEQFLAAQTVAEKTLLNYHTGLSALWTWCVSESLAATNILHNTPRPRPDRRAIVPYSEADIRGMLAALGTSRRYVRPAKGATSHSLPHPERNRAIILLLLDTGMRAEELVSLAVKDADLRNRSVIVMGKGRKERILPISPSTSQAIWRYLAARQYLPADPLFLTSNSGPLDRDRLLKLLVNIGRRAEVSPPINVHRFRHTFAINYLRNGGDPWSLQIMLGHSTMEMVKTYLAVANTDLNNSHRRASPVANWRL